MRRLDLDGTKARYERLKLLGQAEEFGVDLPESATAPFTVRWDTGRRCACVFIADTMVARIRAERGTPELMVRTSYPEKFDFALLRAVRNTADATDEIGKRQRAGKAEASTDAGLFTRNGEAFQPKIQDVGLFCRAALGMESLNRKLTFSHYEGTGFPFVMMEAKFGRSTHTFLFRIRDDGIFYERAEDAAYGLREEVFNAQMETGARLFEEKMVREDLHAACEAYLTKAPPVDQVSVTEDYGAHSPDLKTQLRKGPFTVVREEYFNYYRFNGIRFSRGENLASLVLPPDFGADTGLIVRTTQHLGVQWQIASLGRKPEDYPPLSEEMIAAKIEETDFGYDL